MRRKTTIALTVCWALLGGLTAQAGRKPVADLFQAAAAGELTAVREYLANGGDVDSIDERGHSALWLAAEKGHIDVVAFLIEAGAKATLRDLNGDSILAAAAARGHERIVELLEKAPGVRDEEDQVRRAAAAAALKKHTALAMRLYRQIKAPGRLEAAAVDDSTRIRALTKAEEADSGEIRVALEIAAKLGHEESVKALLEGSRGAVSESGDCFLFAADLGHTKVVDAFLAAGVPPDTLNRTLDVAIGGRDLALLELLLSHGADPNADKGRPLRLAAQGHRVAAVRLLLDAGADPNLGQPLIAAAGAPEAEITRMLLGAGADPSAVDSDGMTPLIRAVQEGRHEAARLLMEAGADLTARDEQGLTAVAQAFIAPESRVIGSLLYERLGERASLSDAAAAGDLSRVRKLLDTGTELDLEGRRFSPLAIAALCGRRDVARALLDAGAPLQAQLDDAQAIPPLAAAAMAGDVDLIKAMVEHAASRKPPLQTASLFPEGAVLAADRMAQKEAVRALLSGVADPNRVLPGGGTLVTVAVRDGRADLLGAVLQAHGDPNTEENGETALMVAASRVTANIVPQLIRAGAKLEARNRDGRTALMLSAGRGFVGHVEALLAAGADITATDKDGRTALHQALDAGKLEVAKLLLARSDKPSLETVVVMGDVDKARELLQGGADAKARGADGTPVLNRAVDHPEIVAALIDAGADIEARDNEGRTALMACARAGALGSAEVLIRRGAAVDSRDNERRTPLLHACYAGQADIARALMDAGADPSQAIDEGVDKGWSPLMQAAYRAHVDVVQLLLSAGVDPRAEDWMGGNAMLAAAEGRDHRLARWLFDRIAAPQFCDFVIVRDVEKVRGQLAKGADPNQKLGHVPALMFAAAVDEREIARMLLEKGAFVNAANRVGWNALMTAAGLGHVKMVELLLEFGADVALTDERGWTALMAAANHGQLKALELLLAAAADPSVKNNEGKTALDLAISKKHETVIDRLSKIHDSEIEGASNPPEKRPADSSD